MDTSNKCIASNALTATTTAKEGRLLATTSVPKQRYKDPASVSPVPEEKECLPE
jgi:hypothetical protein